MSEFEILDIGTGIKVNLDTSGLTNGQADVTSITYDTDGYIGQLNKWITDNNLSQEEILDILRGLNPQLDIILNEVKKPQEIDFNEVFNTIKISKDELIKTIYNRLKPIYIEKPYIIRTTNYVEIRTTKYIYTKDPQYKGKEKVEKINWGTSKPENDDYLELIGEYKYKIDRFGRAYFKVYGKEYRENEFLSKFKTPSVVDSMLEKGIIDKKRWKSLKTTF